MIDKESARKIIQEKLAENLVIVDSFESPNVWCFGLGLLTMTAEFCHSWETAL
ncbi:hypothetical protein SAMN04487928_10480 [Butyrivibrio proteoclasticus]|uniref:Uncharacterized protein n=1 Tax=Butyrivibrio proteoclasticus TaxID=43305 RepID=A0A1I5RMX2_9FIRM|nr:hypothetical protein SAMN04487928_10480 [Butyrivibrio proteoclasticus]